VAGDGSQWAVGSGQSLVTSPEEISPEVIFCTVSVSYVREILKGSIIYFYAEIIGPNDLISDMY